MPLAENTRLINSMLSRLQMLLLQRARLHTAPVQAEIDKTLREANAVDSMLHFAVQGADIMCRSSRPGRRIPQGVIHAVGYLEHVEANGTVHVLKNRRDSLAERWVWPEEPPRLTPDRLRSDEGTLLSWDRLMRG